MKTVEKDLVIGYRHLGDTLFTLPAIAALGEQTGKKSIDVVTARGFEALFTHNPYIHHLYLTEKVRTKELMQLLPRIRREHYEALLLFRHTFANALFGVLTGIPKRAGVAWKGVSPLLTHRAFFDPERNERDRYLGIVSALLKRKVPLPRKLLFFKQAEIEEVKQELCQIIPQGSLPLGVYPGSSAHFPVKRWAIQNYAALCQQLLRRFPNLFFLFFAGREKDEGRLCDVLQEEVKRGIVIAPEKEKSSGSALRRMALLFSQLFCYIGNDTGPSHLAAAVNIPVFILNGPQRKEKVAPTGERVFVIEHAVPCRPCKRKVCPHRICLDHLEVSEVTARVSSFLQTAVSISKG